MFCLWTWWTTQYDQIRLERREISVPVKKDTDNWSWEQSEFEVKTENEVDALGQIIIMRYEKINYLRYAIFYLRGLLLSMPYGVWQKNFL